MNVSTKTFRESVLVTQKIAWKTQKTRMLKRGARLPGERVTRLAFHGEKADAFSTGCSRDKDGMQSGQPQIDESGWDKSSDKSKALPCSSSRNHQCSAAPMPSRRGGAALPVSSRRMLELSERNKA